MSRTHEVAWAAGFFDGEGFITIQKRGHKNYVGHYLRIGVNHVAIEPLLQLQKLFGGNIRKQKQETVVGNRHARHQWTLSTSAAAEAIKQMMPYFHNKNNVGALALDFQATVGKTGQKVSEENLILRENFKLEITRQNSLD